MVTREALYQLIDALPATQWETARALLERLRQETTQPLPPVLADAPWDDEPESEDERAAVAEAEEDFRHGRVLSHTEARRRLLGHS